MTLNTIKRCRGAHELNTWQPSLEEQGKRRFTIKPRSTVLHKKEKKTPERITSDISYSKCGERKEGTRAKRVLSIYQTNLTCSLTSFPSLPFTCCLFHRLLPPQGPAVSKHFTTCLHMERSSANSWAFTTGFDRSIY